jgi:hypothetical protein
LEKPDSSRCPAFLLAVAEAACRASASLADRKWQATRLPYNFKGAKIWRQGDYPKLRFGSGE